MRFSGISKLPSAKFQNKPSQTRPWQGIQVNDKTSWNQIRLNLLGLRKANAIFLFVPAP